MNEERGIIGRGNERLVIKQFRDISWWDKRCRVPVLKIYVELCVWINESEGTMCLELSVKCLDGTRRYTRRRKHTCT